MPRLAPSRSAPAGGFTLIEVLVVLAIVALMIAVLPSPFSGLTSIRLSAAADELVDTMRLLRARAVRGGVTTELEFDTRALTYAVSGDPAPRRLPPVIDKIAFTGRRLIANDDIVRIRFFADGSATGDTMRLMHGSSAR